MYVKFFEQILPNVQSKENPKNIKNLKIYPANGSFLFMWSQTDTKGSWQTE